MKLSNKGKHRLFFALELSDDFKQQVDSWRSTLGINGRNVPSENFHITLQFLGSVSNHQVFEIVDQITIPQIKPFSVSLGKTGYFAKNEILFAEVERGVDSIRKLSRFLQQELRLLNYIKQEKRRFHPHLTLAREVRPPVDFEPDTTLCETIKYFQLMESIDIKSGVHYDIVEQWPLYRPSDKEIILGHKS